MRWQLFSVRSDGTVDLWISSPMGATAEKALESYGTDPESSFKLTAGTHYLLLRAPYPGYGDLSEAQQQRSDSGLNRTPAKLLLWDVPTPTPPSAQPPRLG